MAKKRITITIFLIITIIAILTPFALDVFRYYKNAKIQAELTNVNENDVILIDGADILTDEEETELRKTMLPITAICKVAFITTNEKNTSTQSFTVEKFRELLNGNGIIFTIDMYRRYLYIYTHDSNTVLSISKCDSITDNIYTYASSKEYFRCANEAWNQIYYVMSGISIPQPMKHMSNFLISLCIALVFVFFVARGVTKTKLPAEVYQLDKNIKKDVNLENVVFEHIRTTTYSNSSSGGGHSGGGFSGGGGGGHGGGHGF